MQRRNLSHEVCGVYPRSSDSGYAMSQVHAEVPLTAWHTASQVRTSIHATDASVCRKPQGSEIHMTGDRAEARLIRTRAALRRASAARGVTPCRHVVCSWLTPLSTHHPAEASFPSPILAVTLSSHCHRTHKRKRGARASRLKRIKPESSWRRGRWPHWKGSQGIYG